MKLIRIEELRGMIPENHYDLLARRIDDLSIGAKAMRVSLIRMEPTGRADPHTHENAEHLFIVTKGEMALRTAEGEAAFIYPGEVHENYNVGEGETEDIVVTSSLTP